jgi:hypothetical protein
MSGNNKMNEINNQDFSHEVCKLQDVEFKKRGFKDLNTVEDYIRAGKSAVSSMKCYQALVASYAIRVCKIRHGGKSVEKIYTLTDYANDIGLVPKTLQSWTLIYRKVFVHIGIKPEDITPDDWKKASKIAWVEKGVNHSDNLIEGTNRKRDEYKEKKAGKTPEQIKEAFYKRDILTVSSKVVSWNYQMNQIKTKLLDMNLDHADKRTLVEMMEHLDTMSDHINDYLTNVNKKQCKESEKRLLQ